MTGKFATASALRLLVFTILLAGHGFAQAPVTGDPQAASPAAQPPAAQQPAAQQPAATQPAAAQTSGDQEASAQESLRRKKPKDYKNWNYNVGFGANLDSGTTKTFVRGGGGVATAGVARNANKYLGLRAILFLKIFRYAISVWCWRRQGVRRAIFSRSPSTRLSTFLSPSYGEDMFCLDRATTIVSEP